MSAAAAADSGGELIKYFNKNKIKEDKLPVAPKTLFFWFLKEWQHSS